MTVAIGKSHAVVVRHVSTKLNGEAEEPTIHTAYRIMADFVFVNFFLPLNPRIGRCGFTQTCL
jgi:hypothetical protein